MTIDSPIEPTSLRLGRSAFWLHFVPEEFGLSTSWRLSLVHKSPRPKKGHIDAAVMDISLRKPLLTIILGGETFPLFVSSWEKKRGGKITLRGERRVSAGGVKSVSWCANLVAKPVAHRAHLGFDVTIKMLPRASSSAELRIHVPVLMNEPLVAESEVAQIRGEKATVAWDALAKRSVTFVSPTQCELEGSYRADGFHALVGGAQFGARKPIHFSARFGATMRSPDCKIALLLHYSSEAALCLPSSMASPSTLQHDAAQAIARMTDKGAYDVIGMDRAYALPPITNDFDQGLTRRYYSGFPYFPVDASLAMLEWTRFFQDEPVIRVAKICARGIAADFPHLAGDDDDACSNKGAFWSQRALTPGHRKPGFHGFDGEDKFSVLSNARVARSMLEMHERSNEHIFEHVGLNAIRWLMLRQNHRGYYSGDRCDTEGNFDGGPIVMAGAEAIPALVAAFRNSDNEVYIKAAWRIARYVMEEIMPHHPSPSVLPGSDRCDTDSPVGLAALIHSFLHLDNEAPNRRLRESLQQIAARLRIFPFDRLSEPEFNYDGQWGGLYECAFASLGVFNLTREPSWLEIALSLISAAPPAGRSSWRAIPAYTRTMCSLASLIKSMNVNLIDSSITRGWRRYVADDAAHQYVHVAAACSETPVDSLCMVSKADNQTLIMVLADESVESVIITKNKRRHIMHDVVTRTLISGRAPLRKLPFASPWRWGMFTINP